MDSPWYLDRRQQLSTVYHLFSDLIRFPLPCPKPHLHSPVYQMACGRASDVVEQPDASAGLTGGDADVGLVLQVFLLIYCTDSHCRTLAAVVLTISGAHLGSNACHQALKSSTLHTRALECSQPSWQGEIKDGVLRVVQVQVNSAASASCAIFPGDEVVSINGVFTNDMTAAQASSLLTGKPGDACMQLNVRTFGEALRMP